MNYVMSFWIGPMELPRHDAYAEYWGTRMATYWASDLAIRQATDLATRAPAWEDMASNIDSLIEELCDEN